MAERSSAEIRQSLVATRQELTYSIGDLRSKVRELTDVRRQLERHSEAIVIGAVAVGAVIGWRMWARRRG